MADPDNKTSQAVVIDGAARLFSAAFRFGGALNITRAIGTELPLARPAGMSQQTAFEGAFARLKEAGIDIDYYWHWGGEVGHGYDDSAAGMAQFMADVESSAKAAKAVGADFKMATCGWELNGGFLDSHDPSHVLTALSTLDRGLGFQDTDAALQNVTQHTKWSIPWLEDDEALIGAELWVERVVCHARKAATLGVTGIMGIHWRTFEPSLAAKALATAAWNLTVSSADLYSDFAAAAFGPEAGPKAAAILQSLDSFTKPGNAQSCNGQKLDSRGHPTGPAPAPRLSRAGLVCCGRWRADDGKGNPSRDQAAVPPPSAYAFADQFMALRSAVTDPVQLSRFDAYAFMLQYHQRLAEVQRQLHALESVLGPIRNITHPAARQAAARGDGIGALGNFSRAYEGMLGSLLSYATTQGELGMVAMQENMNYQAAMVHSGILDNLANLTQRPIPKAALPSRDYAGPARVFVLTVRTLILLREPAVSIPIVALVPGARQLPAAASVNWKTLGGNAWKNVSAPRTQSNRGWYSGSVPNPGADFEYFVTVAVPTIGGGGGGVLRYPAAGAVQVVIMH